ncbi:hypothetical protein ACFQ4O_00680 [Methylopila musalis]|uniref:Uncharacterized protein n=1 Tax=Methylopila musalis TaxID=1134781 RepID=A0ABW3Z3L4_9HYPH
MPELVSGIHDFTRAQTSTFKSWMPETSSGMTVEAVFTLTVHACSGTTEAFRLPHVMPAPSRGYPRFYAGANIDVQIVDARDKLGHDG